MGSGFAVITVPNLRPITLFHILSGFNSSEEN